MNQLYEEFQNGSYDHPNYALSILHSSEGFTYYNATYTTWFLDTSTDTSKDIRKDTSMDTSKGTSMDTSMDSSMDRRATSIPQMVQLNDSSRFRTDHGFPVAASGACYVSDPKDPTRGYCAIPYEAVIEYEKQEEIRSIPKSWRMMRVLLDAIEDIYLLSQCNVIIAQGTSHFSTISILLLWARIGCDDIDDTTLLLDYDTMVEGRTPTAYLHGTNIQNETFHITSSPGSLRWRIYTNRFIGGLPFYPLGGSNISLEYNPWDVEYRIRIVNGLPRLPREMFYRESNSWGRYETYMDSITEEEIQILSENTPKFYNPPWPGSCPSDNIEEFPIDNYQSPYNYIVWLVNLGSDHNSEWHYDQASRCWLAARKLLQYYARHSTIINSYIDLEDIITGNIEAQSNRFRFYAKYVPNASSSKRKEKNKSKRRKQKASSKDSTY